LLAVMVPPARLTMDSELPSMAPPLPVFLIVPLLLIWAA
jgi:hypothetical protein